MKPIYQIGQRLSFIAQNKCTYNGNRIGGKWQHFVGYVKQVRRRLFGVYYVMNVSKSTDIYIVPQHDIMGVVEKKEELNKPNKSDENGNI